MDYLIRVIYAGMLNGDATQRALASTAAGFLVQLTPEEIRKRSYEIELQGLYQSYHGRFRSYPGAIAGPVRRRKK